MEEGRRILCAIILQGINRKLEQNTDEDMTADDFCTLSQNNNNHEWFTVRQITDTTNNATEFEEIDEGKLEDFVFRVIYSSTMNDGDDDIHGIVHVDDGQKRPYDNTSTMPRRKLVKMEDVVNQKKKVSQKGDRHHKRNQRKLSADLTVDDIVVEEVKVGRPHGRPNGLLAKGPIITLPLHVYRKMVKAESGAEIRSTEDYFRAVEANIRGDTDKAVRDVYYWQDRCFKYEEELKHMGEDHRSLQISYEYLQDNLTGMKEARKRRKYAQKIRSRENIAPDDYQQGETEVRHQSGHAEDRRHSGGGQTEGKRVSSGQTEERHHGGAGGNTEERFYNGNTEDRRHHGQLDDRRRHQGQPDYRRRQGQQDDRRGNGQAADDRRRYGQQDERRYYGQQDERRHYGQRHRDAIYNDVSARGGGYGGGEV